jgi:hypothetical protein
LFCCGGNLRPALLSHSLVSLLLFGCWTADALSPGPHTLLSQVVRCHCALAYRLHSAEHSPSVVLCTLSPRTKSRPLLYASVRKSALLGLKIKLVCLWVKGGGEIAVLPSAHASLVPTGCSPERT